jgi:preprotein translocase subunit SecA
MFLAHAVKDAAKEADEADDAAGYRDAGLQAKTPEEATRVGDMAALQADIYQFYGYRFDYRESDAKKPQKVYDRMLAEIPLSLTEQRERLLDLIDGIVGSMVEECCPPNKQPEDWDWKGIRQGYAEHFGKKPVDYEDLHSLEDIAHKLYGQAEEFVFEREKEWGTELLLRIFRLHYLEEIDRQWVEHLTNMEHLRDGIGLRGYGQRDPKQEYKKEGYNIFVSMMARVSSEVAIKVFQTKVQRAEQEASELERMEAERIARQAQSMQLRHGSEIEGEGDEKKSLPPAASRRPPPQIIPKRQPPKVQRNDQCPCGSGMPFNKCHGAVDEEDGGDATA